MKAEVRYFSATGIGKKIADEFVRGLGLDTRYVNITRPDNRETVGGQNTGLEIFVVPVHGERIPGFLYNYLHGIKGNGRPLVTMAVYGNVGMGISLAQFEKLARETNFNLIAAGAFVGEHTFCHFGASGASYRQSQSADSRLARNHVGEGRPDPTDLADLYYFGQQVRRKVDMKLAAPVKLPGPRVPMFIAGFPERGTRFIVCQPDVDNNICRKCGDCAKNCPVGAIRLDSLEIDVSKCIRCMACIHRCPVGARTSMFKASGFDWLFRQIGKTRRKNVFYC
jgi:ferredoxin